MYKLTKKYLITGIITIIPVIITLFLVQFLFKLIIQLGEPFVVACAKIIHPWSPFIAKWLLQPWFGTLVAIIIVILSLDVLGFIATRVFGKKIIEWFDLLMDRIPFIKTIYGASKKLITALERKPDGVERVVLIDFPHTEMKTVGFVTNTFLDQNTGNKLAAVYVPTTPNPTSGYLEIVPMDKVTSTNWTVDEAMTFIVSGGAVAPSFLSFVNSPINKDDKVQ